MNYQCAHRWVFKNWRAALEPVEDDLGPISGHEVTVRVTHCGMCHSDLHVQAGGFDMGGGKMSSIEATGCKLPVTMGHEIVGEVVATGPDVKGVPLGLKVIVYPWLGCGTCPTCLSGEHHMCPVGARSLGVRAPGGYSDLVRVRHEEFLVPYGALDPARAATFACAGITAFSAIRKMPDVTGNDWLAVVGCGGLGLTAVSILSATSQARVLAVDPDPAKRATALQHGAALAVDPNAADALAEVAKTCGGAVAGAVDFVGSEASSSFAVQAVRRSGKVVIVGLFGGEFRLSLPIFVSKQLTVTGSYVGSLAMLRELVALAQTTQLPAIPIDLRPLHTVNQALDDLAHGRVAGRLVLQP